jgi:hypothetical protein
MRQSGYDRELYVFAKDSLMRATAIILFVLALAASGCGGNSTTAPSGTTTTTTTPVAPPTISDTWQSVLPVGGFKIFSFGIPSTGTVNITLTGVSGQFVPSTVQLGVGIGTPEGTDCTTTQTVTTASGSTAQITTTEQAGIYCARVFDVGNLFAPANFSVQIDHP